MRVNLTVDLNAESIAAIADQLPSNEFGKFKGLIEEKALMRFRNAMTSAGREIRRRGLTRKDFQCATAGGRGRTRAAR